MAVRKLIQIGDSKLKAKNKLVTNLQTPEVKRLLKDLKDTMRKTGLVGIAAPQIGENYMVFLTHPRNTKSRKLSKTDKLRVFINPSIIHLSRAKSIIYEGCGSVVEGDLFGPVVRSREVEVKATDEKGNKFSLRCDGLLARVILHEIDHLNGNEFITKVSDYKKLVVHKYYKERIKNSVEQRTASKITKVEYRKL